MQRSGFGAATSVVFACIFLVFYNSVSAGRGSVAVSRFLAAAAACVLRLSFAAARRKSYWSGCIKGALVICQHVCVHFGAYGFPSEMAFKKMPKNRLFFTLAPGSGFAADSFSM